MVSSTSKVGIVVHGHIPTSGIQSLIQVQPLSGNSFFFNKSSTWPFSYLKQKKLCKSGRLCFCLQILSSASSRVRRVILVELQAVYDSDWTLQLEELLRIIRNFSWEFRMPSNWQPYFCWVTSGWEGACHSLEHCGIAGVWRSGCSVTSCCKHCMQHKGTSLWCDHELQLSSQQTP